MLHIASHFLVPLVVALVGYRARWRHAALLMAATMVVDIDHLLAVPIYDPVRCSIGFHPLHSTVAIALYAAAFVAPLLIPKHSVDPGVHRRVWPVHIVGLGLLIHMALDWTECARR